MLTQDLILEALQPVADRQIGMSVAILVYMRGFTTGRRLEL